MSSEVIKVVSAEIVPRPNLTGVEEAIETLKGETGKLESLRVKADAMQVDTPEQCAAAKALQLEVRGIGKQAGFNLDRYWEVVKRVSQVLGDIYDGHEKKAKAIDDSLKVKVKAFEQKEREAAQREQDRINADNARLAREKAETERVERERIAKEHREARVKEIKAMQRRGDIGKREAARLLKEAGADAEAAIEQAAADAEAAKNAPPPQVKVKPNIPAVAGVPSTVHYYAEVKDPEKLIEAYSNARILQERERALYLRQFLMPNAQALGSEARRVKNSRKLNADIPGVHFHED